jgi:hypothetical protein
VPQKDMTFHSMLGVKMHWKDEGGNKVTEFFLLLLPKFNDKQYFIH